MDGSILDDGRWERLVLCRTRLSPSDQALFREAFPMIVAMHHKAVWDQIRKRGLLHHEAEELLQDTFWTLFSYVVENGFPADLSAMLATIAQGKILNHVRDRRRTPVSLGLPSSGSEKPRSAPDIERALDLHELVQRILPELAPEHLDVIDKVILGDLSHEAAAKALEIPEGTVKSRLIAAKRTLARVVSRFLPPSQRGDT